MAGDARPRGRRPFGKETRAALLEAARARFAELGYSGTTVRSIATLAGADPSMINHWFGGKAGLFAEAFLMRPPRAGESPERAGDTRAERVVRRFLTEWDAAGGVIFSALLRSPAGPAPAQRVLREHVIALFDELVVERPADERDLRVAVCAAQLIGIAMLRYVLPASALASADRDAITAAVAPYLRAVLASDQA